MTPIGIVRTGTFFVLLFLTVLTATLLALNKQQQLMYGCLVGTGICILVLVATIGGIWSRIGRLGRATGRGIAQVFGRVAPHARGAAAAGGARIAASPAFYISVLSGIMALICFSVAYAQGQAGFWLHSGVTFTLLTIVWGITHLKKWGDIWGFIVSHPAGMWLTVSILALTVSVGHVLFGQNNAAWGPVAWTSFVSTILATITVLGWWRATWKLFWSWFLKPFWLTTTFRKGFTRGMIMWIVIMFLTMVPDLLKQGPAPNPEFIQVVGTVLAFLLACWPSRWGKK